MEFNSTLTSILNTHTVASPQFIDYSEDTETLLVTSRSPDAVYEIEWGSGGLGTILWTSTISLNDPSCATYSQKGVNKMVISDTGNNRIVLYNRTTNQYTARENCTFRSDLVGENEVIPLYRPFRSYQLYDDQICVVEERGQLINFDTMFSSSSSSSSSG